ncbi:MAG: transcription elongation factor GreA [Alphaproteobacteria bacterium]|nr:transcription elongation factor GreA [Alphaproteobacteria bacterium]MDD9920469.1 transcription elongation factor GreA [Alphaproteobacteria bacterium]
MERVPMTTYGYSLLEQELKHLQKVERPAIIAAIDEARGHGDLKENAEYHAAKEKQGFIEGRIQELDSKLSRAELIDPTKLSGERIVMGATVVLVDADTDKEVTYILVGPDEADIEKGLISVTSPIGKALIGKSTGDEAIVRAPSGNRTYDVEDVQFKEITV